MRTLVWFVVCLALVAMLPASAEVDTHPEQDPGYTGGGYCTEDINCVTGSVKKDIVQWKTWTSADRGYDKPVIVCKGDVLEFKWQGYHDLVVATSAQTPCTTGKSRLSKPLNGTAADPAEYELRTKNVKVGTYPVISSVGNDCAVGKMHLLVQVTQC